MLRDAAMLDALGTIGIMQAFMSKGHLPSYDPNAPFGAGRGRWPPASASDQMVHQAKKRYAFMNVLVTQVRRELGRYG